MNRDVCFIWSKMTTLFDGLTFNYWLTPSVLCTSSGTAPTSTTGFFHNHPKCGCVNRTDEHVRKPRLSNCITVKSNIHMTWLTSWVYPEMAAHLPLTILYIYIYIIVYYSIYNYIYIWCVYIYNVYLIYTL